MPHLTFWDIIFMVLALGITQAGTFFLLNSIDKGMKKRKDNTICDLYINDELSGKHTYQECRYIYEKMDFKGHKGSGFNKKTKTFYIDVDQ